MAGYRSLVDFRLVRLQLVKHPILLLATILSLLPISSAEANEPLRVVIETDAGGDPDDEQSLVRWLLYTNEWDVEAIIANRAIAREGENKNRERTGLGIVQQLVRAYGQCYPRLAEHDSRYPNPDTLLSRVVAGYDDRNDAVDRLIGILDSQDPRPVWYADWGTDRGAATNNLKRALDRIMRERGQDAYAKLKKKLRVFGYPELFGDHATKLAPPFPLLVNTFQPPLDGLRWYHRFSALTAKASGFDIQRDVISDHGPLGALYPTNTTHAQKEGDTMTFLSWIPTGMNDPAKPEWGSWAGRYGINRDSGEWPNYWANQADTWEGSTHRDNTIKRWAVAIQNDFRARMDWCAKSRAEANHPPQPRLKGQPDEGILFLHPRAGSTVTLDASLTTDPDNQKLTFEWFVYPEPGTYRGDVRLTSTDTPATAIELPADSANKLIHVILCVTDSATPLLTRYRRIILEPTSNN
jgi:Protein of unknown function (DUF1593)